ncbi:MAG: fibronectin type III domain-containing protein [Crocinitomicaceae bacterium]|nr:fibronectin type III domain-containing protein [Crocinitomicaceae bacterium]
MCGESKHRIFREEIFFRNNGYSSVCTFTYGNIASSLADGITLTLNSTGTGTRMGYTWWNMSSTFTGYKLEVRKTGNPDYAWFPYESSTGELKVYQLEPSTQYECRVKGLIGDDYESDWSNTSVFTTQPVPEYNCGNTTLPAGTTTITPLMNAISGLTFTVGQFEMMVTDIEPLDPILKPGHYRGTGKIAVAFLYNIRVSFEDILVDDNLMVRSGKVEAISEGIDAWMAGMLEPDYYVDGTITDFEFNDSTSLTVWVDGVPQTFSFADHDPIIIQDEDGMIYVFNSDGTYTIHTTLTYSTDVLAASADYRIDFDASENQEFGFDKKEYAPWINEYEVIRLIDSTNYFVPYKSISPDGSDEVIAKITSDITLLDVNFIAVIHGSETTLSHQKNNDSTYTVTLSGLDESCYVYARHGNLRIGKLWVKSLPEIEKEIVIVPVNGATLSQPENLETELNKIYAQANVSLSVSIAENFQSTVWDLNADGKLQNGDVSLMSHYSEEMRALRDAYFESDTAYNKQAYYLFVVPQFYETELDGYMVRGKAVGFLKTGENAITAAHELAHGIFALEHTFPEVEQGTTENLMDYSNASHLRQAQWYRMHEPLPALSFLDDEEEGASIVVDGEIPESLRNPDGTMTFISPSGYPITIPANATEIEFFTLDPLFISGEFSNTAPIGTLLRFKIENGNSDQIFSFAKTGDEMHYKNQSGTFYIDSLTNQNKPSKAIVGFPFFQNEFYVQLYYLDLTQSANFDALSIQYNEAENETTSDFNKYTFSYIERFSVLEVLFGIEQPSEDNASYILNEFGQTEWLLNPSYGSWQNIFNVAPEVVLNCTLNPAPGDLGLKYIQDNSEFTNKGNPIGVIIISNSLWLSRMQTQGMLSYFECYVANDPINSFVAIADLVSSLNKNLNEGLTYDFSQINRAFEF